MKNSALLGSTAFACIRLRKMCIGKFQTAYPSILLLCLQQPLRLAERSVKFKLTHYLVPRPQTTLLS